MTTAIVGWKRMATVSVATLGLLPAALDAQEVTGRILDSANGAPIGLAAVFLLDEDRAPLVASAADVEGRYQVQTPGAGEYYLVVERLGYFENQTPLLAVGEAREYGIDIELRPEPFHASAPQCGALFVDDYRCPNELIEEIDMDRIAVVVTLEGSVHLYTREFDWTFRPGGGEPAC